MSFIYGTAFLEWLVKAGVVPENTSRVVIEAGTQGPVIIYAELWGTTAMVSVEPPPELKGATIKILGKQ